MAKTKTVAWILSILTLLTTASLIAEEGAPQDDQKFDLRYKFEAGDTIRYSVEHRASIRSTIDGATQSALTNTESIKVWKVIDVMPDGEIEFVSLVERVKMDNRLPDRAPTKYDSEQDETPPPGFEDAAKAIGVPLSIVRMTSHGKVISREVKHHQPAANQDGPVAVLLPEKPVAIEATWAQPFEVTVQLKAGGQKAIQTRRHFKLTKVAHGIATIKVTYQVLSPINAHIESQLVQRMMKGTVQFDLDLGRLMGQEMDIDKRILGFAGPTSSMHYVMRMREELLKETPEVAIRP